jgi:DNA gyrase/topoisomerase IV subunit B
MATNLQFIKSASGTSVSSLSVTDCFNANYDVYEIIIRNFQSSANLNSPVYFRFKYSGGVDSTANYDYARLGMKAYATFTETRGTNATSALVSYANQDLDASTGTRFYIYNPYDSSSYSFYSGIFSHYYQTNGLEGYRGIWTHTVAQQNTGFRLLMNGSEVADLEINVYGVK